MKMEMELIKCPVCGSLKLKIINCHKFKDKTWIKLLCKECDSAFLKQLGETKSKDPFWDIAFFAIFLGACFMLGIAICQKMLEVLLQQ